MVNRVCVFCGAFAGKDEKYKKAAQALGAELVKNNLGLVYGGGNVGLMGTVADAVLASGGEVIGVIPKFLMDKELGHLGCTELKVVETMHQRKALMAEYADAFVALPGGFGTLEEIFEVTTWLLLGAHRKPCAILDVDGYYAHLMTFLDHITGEGFITREDRQLLMFDSSPEKLVGRLLDYQPAPTTKWMALDKT